MLYVLIFKIGNSFFLKGDDVKFVIDLMNDLFYMCSFIVINWSMISIFFLIIRFIICLYIKYK